MGIPDYAHRGDAGFDLQWNGYPGDVYELIPGHRISLGTGLFMAVPYSFELQIRSRSGLARDHGICVLNAPGTIDGGYRGEIQVILINLGQSPYLIRAGDRIAQGVLSPIHRAAFFVTEILEDTDRGESGFGSTGS